ncbi:hypothetical protein KKH27_05705 [bacterium]|nr:hypothetical protein [bacterium]MBU1983448.1 hypothetical protein [bacterium]
MSDTKFPRSERLRGRTELERVRKEGRRRVLPELVLFFYPGSPIAASRLRRRGPSETLLSVTDTFANSVNTIA